MSNSKDSDKRYARYQKITEEVDNAKRAAYDFLKNHRSGSLAFKDMLKKLTDLAIEFGRYQLFCEISSCIEALHGYNKMQLEEARVTANINQSVATIRKKINSKKERIERKKIISNTKFKTTIVSEDSTIIKDANIIVNAERNDIMIIKAIIPYHHKNRKTLNKKLRTDAFNEMFNIATIFRLEKCKSGEYELCVKQMRIRLSPKTEEERCFKFHIEKGMLTVHKKNKVKMVRMSISKLLGNMQTGYRIDTPFGTIGVAKHIPDHRSPVGSIFIKPLEEEKSDTWYSKSRKILRDTVPLMRFITTRPSEICSEEHRYDDRSVFYFHKDINKFYPILANRRLEHLAKKIFKRSREGGFAEDISKLAEAVTIANTYSPSWKIRLICMIEALETWGSCEKLNLIGKHFYVKLRSLFKKYIDKYEQKDIGELNRVRNNLMHDGIASPVNFKHNKNKDKIYEQKDESKYYFFKFRELFVEIFLSELKWEGEYYSYSCSKNGIVTHTNEKR